MRVKVIIPKDNIKLNIPVPLGIFLNRLTCPLIAHFATKYTEGLYIDGDQLHQIAKSLKQSKKIHGHYTLVDIESSDGEIVKIEI